MSQLGLLDFSAELFEPYVGQVFAFSNPEGPGGEPARVELELLEIKRWGRPEANRRPSVAEALAPGRQPFSMLFRSSSPQPVGFHPLRMKSPDFGGCELLVTRILAQGRDPKFCYYEVVMN
jgi:hypothetical protein